MIKKYLSLTSFAGILMIAVASPGMVRAATYNAVFDPVAGTLTVSGSCSSLYVMVIIRHTSDGSIWGSSNPRCSSGSYRYSASVPESDRNGNTFIVQAFDASSADMQVPSSSMQQVGATPVTFSAPSLETFETTTSDAVSISLDEASVAATSNDQSFLDAAVGQFFGIIADITNSVKATIVAAVNLFAKSFAILPGGSITVPEGANQISGEAWLGGGAMDVFIPNTAVTSSSRIIVTPTSPTAVPLAVTNKEDGIGFHVGVLAPQTAAISFDWLILQTYQADAPATTVASGGGTTENLSVVPADTSTISDASSSASDVSASSTDASSTDSATPTDITTAPTSTASSTTN